MTPSHPAWGLLSQELRKTAHGYRRKRSTTGLLANSFSGGSWRYGGFPLGTCALPLCVLCFIYKVYLKKEKKKTQQLLMSEDEQRAEVDVLIRGVVSKNS